MRRHAPVLLLALGLPALAHAQGRPGARPDSTAPGAGSLADTVVVTATRTAEDARRTGRAVTVITAADIARAPATSLDELLRTAAGVEVLTRGPLGAQSDFSIRGSTFGGVLLLIDGVRANDPQTGHFLTDFPIPLAEVARVEVLRGPAAAVYGPDAVGGVVHVLTKTAAGATAPAGSALTGTHRTSSTDFAVPLLGRRLLVGFAAARQETDGEAVPSLTTDGPMGRRARTDLTRTAYTGAFRLGLGPGTLTGRVGYDDRFYGSVRHYTFSARDTARSTAETWWGQAAYRADVGRRTAAEVTLGFRRHASTYRFNPVTAPNDHTNRQGTLTALVRHRPAPGLTLTAGAQGLAQDITSTNMGDHADAAAGVFAGARFARGALALDLTGRLDRDPGFGTEATPQASLAYTQPRFTLRAAGGRAVRAPSYTERYYNALVANVRDRDVGNPDLRAERAWSAEAGADVFAAAGARLGVTGFWRRTANLIDFVRATAADTVFLAQNLLGVTARGVEAEAALRRGPVRASLAYTLLDLAVTKPAGSAPKYATVNARHTVGANLSVDVGPATLGLRSLVRDPYPNGPDAAPPAIPNPRTDEPYAVHDLRAAVRLPGRYRFLTATAEVRNVLDEKAVEVFAPIPGRWWLVGVRFGG